MFVMLMELLWAKLTLSIFYNGFDKKQKKLLILGGSSDIGVELTKLFLSKGWHVTVHYSGKNLIFKKKINTLPKYQLHKVKF